jgi:hypothetical protein
MSILKSRDIVECRNEGDRRHRPDPQHAPESTHDHILLAETKEPRVRRRRFQN